MSLWYMSISGAIMIVAIVVIRALAINRLPKKTFLTLWGVALIRLLVPYSLPSMFSVYSLAGRLTQMAEDAAELSAAHTMTTTPIAGVAATSFSSAMSGTSVPSINLWIVVWLIGMAVCAMFFAVAYWKFRLNFRKSIPVDNGFIRNWLTSHKLRRTMEVRQSDKIPAPLTYGVFYPVILLPKRTNWEDETALAYVLAHEYVHIRRFDTLTKLVLTATLCVHWFNPAVWVMYVLANRDIELSCDEAVVRQFGEHTKSAYAMTLIRMEETKSGLSPLCNSFSKNAIEERIVAIMKIKKISLAAVLVAIALVVGFTTAFATSAQTTAQDDNIALSDEETVNNSAIQSGYDSTGSETATESGNKCISADDSDQQLSSELLAEYVVFGLTYDESAETLYWKGKPVRYFNDSVDIDGNSATAYQYLYREGTVDIYTVRQATQNADGSTDPFGKLTGIEEYKAGELDIDSLFSVSTESVSVAEDGAALESVYQSGQETVAAGDYTAVESGTGTEFMAVMAKYEPFGVTLVKSGDFGNLYWNGRLVDILVDHSPDGGYTTVSSTDEGGIKIQTVYGDDGSLVRVEEF